MTKRGQNLQRKVMLLISLDFHRSVSDLFDAFFWYYYGLRNCLSKKSDMLFNSFDIFQIKALKTYI